MRVDLAAPPPATAPLARTGNSGLQGKRVRRSTHRPAAATTRSATASPPINRHDRRAAIRTPRARHSNPHSARGTAARSPSAVSSPGGFRTPAPGVPGTDTHRAGIRNPSQQRRYSGHRGCSRSGQERTVVETTWRRSLCSASVSERVD